MHQYIGKTRSSVEKVHRANEELEEANAELATRNDDLHERFDFATGLAAQAHDRHALVSFADGALEQLTGSRAHVVPGKAPDGADALESGGAGSVCVEVADNERWELLRDAIVPQLATAVESATLVEEMRKRHLTTIAALSRSMEAKDGYTGGHTERVADVAVAIARRMGYAGDGLEAIQIGALLHDIGKVGIPERILHKPGPLDDAEWELMRTHPVVSEQSSRASTSIRSFCRSRARATSGSTVAATPTGSRARMSRCPRAARSSQMHSTRSRATSRTGPRVRCTPPSQRSVRTRGAQFCPAVADALARGTAEERLELTPVELLHVVAVA